MAASDITPEIVAILTDASRLGIELKAVGGGAGQLRFRPRLAMTPDLAQRLKANKPALLKLLRDGNAADTTPSPKRPIDPQRTESGVLSVVSVSDAEIPQRGPWNEDELAMLARAGTTPADLPLVTMVKDVFADMGATVVSVEPVKKPRGSTRRHAAQLIRDARRIDTDQAVAMRDAWRERLAICTVDGGLTNEDAEQVALAELERMLH